MHLRQLLNALPQAQLMGSADVEIRDAAYDSRRVEPGFLFIAVPTVGGDARSGGYQHIATALERGAVAIVSQAPADVSDSIPLLVVPDSRQALADIAAELFGHPSRELGVYAVTGTDGKTTTTFLLDSVFTAAGLCTGLIGTVETKIAGKSHFNADRRTTPESLDLQRLLRSMLDSGVTHVSIEASSHALALERLRGTRFAACALTNVTADHIEFHGTWDAYFAAKASLFSELAPGRPAVLNWEDASYARLLPLIQGPVLTYGWTPEADITVSDVEFHSNSTSFGLYAQGKSAATTLSMPGAFNVSNAMAVTGLALYAGLSLEHIAEALTHASPPPGRMQHIDAGQDFEVVVDYAHTPNAFESVLSSVRRTTSQGRVIAVFGAAGNRDRAKRPQLAQIARRHTDYFFITNEDPFGEQPDAIMAEVASGANPAEEGTRYECEPERTLAIGKAISLARPGDAVIILGKGHEQSIMVNGHKEPWSDSRVASEALEGLR